MLIISLPVVSHIFPCEFLIQGSIIYSPLPVHIRSAEDILEDSCFHSLFVQVILRLLSHSSHLILLVQSPFQSFPMVFSFEWALTHRSFPRILPDSSNFPGAIPKFFWMFNVRTNFISHVPSPRSHSTFFPRWLNLSILHSGVPQQFMVVFLIVILEF